MCVLWVITLNLSLLLPPQIWINMCIKGTSLRLQNGSCVTVSVTMKWDHLTYHNTVTVGLWVNF